MSKLTQPPKRKPKLSDLGNPITIAEDIADEISKLILLENSLNNLDDAIRLTEAIVSLRQVAVEMKKFSYDSISSKIESIIKENVKGINSKLALLDNERISKIPLLNEIILNTTKLSLSTTKIETSEKELLEAFNGETMLKEEITKSENLIENRLNTIGILEKLEDAIKIKNSSCPIFPDFSCKTQEVVNIAVITVKQSTAGCPTPNDRVPTTSDILKCINTNQSELKTERANLMKHNNNLLLLINRKDQLELLITELTQENSKSQEMILGTDLIE